jgi:hypothetical protein
VRILPATLVMLGLLAAGAPVRAADVPKHAPSPETKGTLSQWQSGDGLAYYHRVPADYDPEQGANLTLILHGSNLTGGWGFANHRAKTFRPHDIVVSPDGTATWRKSADSLKLRPADVKAYDGMIEGFETAITKGYEIFDEINKTQGEMPPP